MGRTQARYEVGSSGPVKRTGFNTDSSQAVVLWPHRDTHNIPRLSPLRQLHLDAARPLCSTDVHSFVFVSCFLKIEVKFTLHKMNHFKVYISAGFSTFTMLRHHHRYHRYLGVKHFYHLTKGHPVCTHYVVVPLLPPPSF